MGVPQIYIMIGIVVLLAVFAVVFFMRKDKRRGRLRVLAGVALGFILFGIAFAEEWFGYWLIGVGVVLSVVDVYWKGK